MTEDKARHSLVASLRKAASRRFPGLFKKALYDSDTPCIMWPWMYAIFVTLFRISFVIWGRWKVSGRENLPDEGAYVVAANHVSYIDPPLLGGAIKRYAYFMAKAELFDVPVFGRAIPRVGAFPVKRGSADRFAFKRALDLLAHHQVLAIFPEGTRGTPGQLGEAEQGFARIVYKARVPVVPMAIINSAELLPRSAKWLHSSRVRVRIGKPVHFDDLWDLPDTRHAVKEISGRTMAAIAALLDAPAT